MSAALQRGFAFWLALLAAGCGGSPTQPGPEELRMSCPNPLVQEPTSASGATVVFTPPMVAGGRSPVAVSCAPASGDTFPLGATLVTCTAADAATRQSSCSFTVTVRASRTLGRTRFLAFGDSITWGQFGPDQMSTLGPPDTYPFRLEEMLRARYPTQTIGVSNQGLPGETTPRGALRLPGVLDTEKPEVLLLLEGVNNVRGLSTAAQLNALRSMIEAAQQRRVDVVIATVMAISPTREASQPGTQDRIRALNQGIFGLAVQYNLGPPVDLFPVFEDNPRLLSVDGLHPTLAGQLRIAEAFRDAILLRYHQDR